MQHRPLPRAAALPPLTAHHFKAEGEGGPMPFGCENAPTATSPFGAGLGLGRAAGPPFAVVRARRDAQDLRFPKRTRFRRHWLWRHRDEGGETPPPPPRPSHAAAGEASGSRFPMTVKVRGCSPPPIVCGAGGGGGYPLPLFWGGAHRFCRPQTALPTAWAPEGASQTVGNRRLPSLVKPPFSPPSA